MKELSIEEKAERYDEAIKVAKRNYDTIIRTDKDCTFAKEGIINTFHHIFPELAESEDERIRNNLIDYFSNCKALKFSEQEIVAWLEKQGEQKPTWSEEDEENISMLIDLVESKEESMEVKIELSAWLKSLKERMKK